MMARAAIAAQYAAAPMVDLDAIPSWRALARDSVTIAKRLRRALRVTLTDATDPYVSAEAMFCDLRQGHFTVSVANSAHPVWSVDENTAFRIVHDVLGHYTSGSGFTWEGEVAAYRKHAAHVSPAAQRALYTEAIGQVAYAIHHGTFGPQKVAFLHV